jgi:hypothetical protein
MLLSRERVTRAIKWIARGLYFHWHHEILPDNYQYQCALVSQAEAEHGGEKVRKLGMEPKWSIGSRSQFKYFHVWFEDPYITYWQMVFHECEFVILSSTPPGMSREEFERRYV